MALASLHFSRGLHVVVALTSDPQVSVTCYSIKHTHGLILIVLTRVTSISESSGSKSTSLLNPGNLIQLPVYQQKQIDKIWTMSHRLSQDFKGHLLQSSV